MANSFQGALGTITSELEKFNEEPEAVVKEEKTHKEPNYKRLAEKALVVKHLKEKKKELSEKEKAFVTQVESIVLSDDARAHVKEAITELLKESK